MLHFEAIDTAPEQHATGARKTMYGNSILLQQKHFVDVGGDNCLLAEAQLQQQRHKGFIDLAQQGFLRRQKQVLGQLLRQGATALHCPASLSDSPTVRAEWRMD